MGRSAGRFVEHDGGKFLAAHRALDGKGPLGLYGLADLVAREYGCRPSEAIDEIRNNPHIFLQLQYRWYRNAYIEVHRWHSLSDEQKKNVERPKGKLVQLADKNREQSLTVDYDQRRKQMDDEGRL